MTEDLSTILREIADLMRQRNEQTAEMSKRAAERLARVPEVSAMRAPDYAALATEHRDAAIVREEEAKRRRVEDLDFRERLLAKLERQNELIARLVERPS